MENRAVEVAEHVIGSINRADTTALTTAMRIEEIHSGLADRLMARREEIEQATLTRIHSVSSPDEGLDPEYLDGLRTAVSAALDYGIAAVAHSGDRPPPIPTVLLAQARLAARHGVRLETVLRRYVAGHSLLGDFLIQEAERNARSAGVVLKTTLRTQASVLDRLLSAVGEEYAREAKAGSITVEQRRVEHIERLLAGEPLDTPISLEYDFQLHHIGVIASGPEGLVAISALAKALDCRLLTARPNDSATWAWLGARRKLDIEDFQLHASPGWPEVRLAVGEPGGELAGWRLTHQQARAVLPIAMGHPPGITRYADVALLASIRQDEVLRTSLQNLYLTPLSEASHGGAVLRETLRAYFASNRNVSSAAAVLRIDRHTVTKRIRVVEERVGRTLDECALDLQIALRLAEVI